MDDSAFDQNMDKWQKTLDLMTEVFSAPAAFLLQIVSENYQVIVASKGPRNPCSAGTYIDFDANSFCRRVIKTDVQYYVSNALNDGEWQDNPLVSELSFTSYLGVPVHCPDGSVFGTLSVMDFKKTNYQKTRISLIWQFKEIIEQDLKLHEIHGELQAQSLQDELTGLFNRRGFIMHANERRKLACRYQEKLALMMLDVNRLKFVNDTYGHNSGDKGLRLLATTLKQTVRETDIAARLGGDEFVLIVSYSNNDDLDQLVERIKSAYIQNCQQHTDLQMLSVSIGNKLIDVNDDCDIDAIIDLADHAMYQDKVEQKKRIA